jgi:hypothetical protein
LAGHLIGIGALAFFLAANAGYSIYTHRVTSALSADARATFAKLRSIVSAEGAPGLVVFSDSYNYPAFPWKGTVNVFSGSAVFQTDTYFSTETVVAMVCTRSESRKSGEGENYCVTGGFEAAAERYGFQSVQVGARNTLYWRTFRAGAAPTP